jgi:HAD superfamily hydrolase (TIGR01509 family)
MLPRPVGGVVFDMDGLLIDTEAVWRDVQLAEAEARGRALPLSVLHSMIGLPWAQSQGKLKDHFGPDYDVDAYVAATAVRYDAVRRQGIALKTGVVELLDLLDALGLPRAIATSSAHDAVLDHLGPNGLLPRFGAIVVHGDYARAKPHPDPYLKAAEAIGVDPGVCLTLEDSHNGVRSAHAAGMMTVMVPDLLAPTVEIAGLCVAVVKDLHEVRAALIASRGV